MNRPQSRQSNAARIMSPATRSVSRHKLRDLGNRLYQKGFNVSTMPSVKRRASHNYIEHSLAVTLTSFQSRQKQQPHILKKQSTVFPCSKNVELKRSETSERLFKTSKRKHPIKMRSQPQTEFVSDRTEPTKYLIDKFSGKFNVDKRYNKQEEEEVEPVKFVTRIVEEPPVVVKGESSLNEYIKLIKKKTMNIDEFLYLKKAEYDTKALESPDPYDLQVVDYQSIKAEQEAAGRAKEYFTISKKGLCHYMNNKPIEFMPLADWLAERDIYNQIKNLKFFNKFRKWKTVKMWKRNVVKRKIQLHARLLQQNLFFLNQDLRSTLLSTRRCSMEMSKQLTFISTKHSELNAVNQSTFTLESFKTSQQKKRRDVAKKIVEYSKENRETVSNGFKKCMSFLRTDMKNKEKKGTDFLGKKGRVESTNKANRRNSAYQALGFVFDMNYEQRSELRKLCSKFVRFSYLIDFVFQQSLAEIYDRSVQDFIRRLEQLHSVSDIRVIDQSGHNLHRNSMMNCQSQSLLQVRLLPSFQPLKQSEFSYEPALPFDFTLPDEDTRQNFLILYHMNVGTGSDQDNEREIPIKKRKIVPDICRKWLVMKPSCEDILGEINHCIIEGLNSLKHFKRWSKHEDMEKYVHVLEEWDDIVCESWEVASEEYLNPNHLLETYSSDTKSQRIASLVKKGFERLMVYIREKFTPFLQTYFENEQVDFNLFSNPNLLNLSQTMQRCMQELQRQKETFTKLIPVTTQLGMLKLDSSDLKNKLVPSPAMMLERIRNLLPDLTHERTLQAKKWLLQKSNSLKCSSDKIEDYVKQINNLRAVQQQFIGKKKQIDNLAHLYQIMNTFKVEIKDRKIFQPQTIQAKDQLQQAMITAEQNTARQNERFSKLVCKNIVPEIQRSLNKLSDSVLDTRFLNLDQNSSDILKELKLLKQKYIELQLQKDKCIVYQKTLNLPDIDFGRYMKVKDQIESRISLLEEMDEWQVKESQWMKQKLKDIKIDQVKEEAKNVSQRLDKFQHFLPQNPISEHLGDRINRLCRNLPVVKALGCEHMGEEHWLEIRNITKLDLQNDVNLTLSELIELRVDQYSSKILEIAHVAEKEKELQGKYDATETAWLNLSLKIVTYKGKSKNAKEVVLLNETAEFLSTLDQLITDILAIICNKYSKSIRAKASVLKDTLKKAQLFFTQWTELQEQWRFLDSLFSSIQSKRVHESGQFESVDKVFKNMMGKSLTKIKPLLANKLLQSTVVTLQKIIDIRGNLQQVYNMIFEYLNEKRKGFPRFYFIDNNDLLNLIYSTSCENVENMIVKCFKGIAKVNFEGDRICSMITEEGDMIKKNVISTVGEVDQIFSSLQEVFVQGVRKLLKNSKAVDDNRKKWINNNPAQSVLTIAKVEFTLYTEITISNQSFHPDSLNEYFLVFCKDQEDFVRQAISGTINLPTKSGDFLTKFQLFLAQDIFHRDVLEEIVANSVINTNQFLWQKHLRFYWDDTTQDMGVTARHLLHSAKYGSQFISWKERTTLTTSTEKLCLKILFAFGHGTNIMVQDQHTLQTVLGLGASLGYNTHMHLCSKQTSPEILIQFLTGVYNVGTWGSLANVHMLTPDSLSFLAQTLEQVHNLLVKTEKRKELESKSHFGFILTTENGPPIPLRLLDLYRIVSLSPANLCQSLKIKLTSLNFQEAAILANKLSKTYEAINVVAGSSEISERRFLSCLDGIKQLPSNPGAEKELVFRHILKWMNANYDKSIMNQAPAILSEVFQIPLDQIGEQVLNLAFGKASLVQAPVVPFVTPQSLQPILQRLSLGFYPDLDSEVCELDAILTTKKCAILVGQASCKSTLVNILSNIQSYPVNLHFVNQSTIPTQIMFGGSKSYGALQSGTNGVYSWMFSTSNTAQQIDVSDDPPERPKENNMKYHDWIVIEGFETNYPLAKINSTMTRYVIIDRKLVYNSGQIMCVPETCKTIIESTHLHNIDPAIVAVSGIMNVNWNNNLLLVKFRSWANHYIADKSLSNFFIKFVEESMVPLLNSAQDLTGLSQLALIDTFLIILENLIGKVKEPKQLKNILAFCAVWGLFSSAQSELKPKIDFLVRKTFQGALPSSQSVFSYYFDEYSMSFKLFSSLINHETIIPNTSFVQTPSNIHLRHLFQIFLSSSPRSILLLTGPQSSCKTAILKHYFYSPSVQISNNLISFNLDMPPFQLKQTLLSKMDTFRKRVITSHIGFDQTRIIIDDVWMKGTHEHVNLDLIRSIVDKRGIYCDVQWKVIKQLRLAIASRFDLKKERISRHCHTFVTETNQEEIHTIFECLVGSKLGTEELRKASKMVTSSTLNVFRKMSEEFPRFFSYKEVNRIINAMGNATIKDLEQLKRYWNFAMTEAFGFKTENCTSKLQEFVAAETSLKVNNPLRPLFSGLGRTSGKDEEVKDVKRLMMIVNQKIELYNKQNRSMPVIEYVTEEKTLEHIARLYRNIPLSNCIQFGAKNSGRTNVTKIVTYIRGYELRVMRPDQDLLKTVVQCQRSNQKGHCTLVVPVEANKALLRQVCEFFSRQFYENVGPALSQQNLSKNEALMKYCEENNIKNVIEFFKQQKGKNMHIVLLMSDKELLKELMETHPHVAQNFTIDYFGEWSNDILSSLAEVNLIDERLSEKESQEVRQATVIGSQIHREISKHVQCSLKQFQDYIKLFVELFQQLKVTCQNSRKVYQESYEKAKEYLSNSEQSGERIDWLRKQCTAMAMQINKMKETIKAFDSQQVLNAMDRMATLNKQIDTYNDKLIEALEKRHSDIRKTVSMLESLDEEKVKALKNAVNPSMGITPILELLMIILNKETDIKEIKEQLSNFKQFLTAIKAVNARTLNSELIRTFRDYSKKEEINNQTIKKLPFGMQFLNVLIAVRNYITEKQRNTEFNGEIKIRQKEIQSIRETYPDIGSKLTQMDNLQKQIDEINIKKGQYEKQTMQLSCKKMIQEKILQIVTDEIDNWNCQYMKYDTRRQGLATDVLLMAAQFIYTGHLPIDKRKKVIEEVRSKLNLQTPCATIYEHLNVDIEALESVTAQQVVFENMVIINNSIKTFLMIDPDRKASEWLRTYAKQIKSVHQEDPSFLPTLSDSVTKGGHLVVEVNKELSPTLYGLVCRIDEDTPTIRINQTEVAVSDEFKLHISMGQPIELTQELLDLFAVINFQLGDEAIDKEVRISMLNKLNPEMLMRQPDIIKRKVALKNELFNQQRNLANLFHTQSKQQDISEKVIKDLELVKLRISELRRNVREQEQALSQYTIPSVVHTTTKAAHVFKRVLSLYCRTNPQYILSTKVQSYCELLNQGVSSDLIKDEKSLFIYLFHHYSIAMDIVNRHVFAFLLALQLMCQDSELCHDIVTYHGEELRKRLSKRQEFSEILAENNSIWRELLLSSYAPASQEGFLLSSKVSTTSNILDRIVIGRLADHDGEYQYQLFVEAIRVMLGEEYLEVVLPTQADIRECGSEILLMFEPDFNIIDYCKQEFPNFVHIRKVDQLEGIAKKGIERLVVLIDGQQFQHVYPIFKQNQALFKDQLILASYFPGIEQYCGFNRIYLPSFDPLARLSQKLLSQGGLQDKFSGSYYWQLHYLQQLLSHYTKLYGGSIHEKLDAKIAEELLPLIDNLALEITAISKTLIKEETTYDEIKEQWNVFNYLLMEVFYGGQPQTRINLIRTLLAKIAQEREYIIDESALTRRLTNSALDQFLLAEEAIVNEIKIKPARKFAKQIKKAFSYEKEKRRVQEIDIKLEALEEKLTKALMGEKKSTKQTADKTIETSKEIVCRSICALREKLRIMIELKKGNYSTPELKQILKGSIPSTWELGSLIRNTQRPLQLGEVVDSLIYRYKYLDRFRQQQTIQLGCIENPKAFLQNYLRQYAKKSGLNYEQLAFVYRLNDVDKEKDFDGLTINKVQLHCAEWDKKARCIISSHQDNEFGQLDISVVPRANKAEAGWTKILLYRQLGDNEPLLELEMPMNTKQGKLRESCLYLT